MGLARFAAVQIINALVVLLVVLFIVTALFTNLADQQKKAAIEETVARMKPPSSLTTKEEIQKWKEEQKRILYEKEGLTKPYWQRVFGYMADALKLDFGEANHMASFKTQSKKVSRIILEALPNTIILFTTATLIVIAIGIFLGMKAARAAGKVLDRVISFLAMLSASLPMWWVGMLMLLLFSYKLNWFPSNSIDVYVAIRHASNVLEELKEWIYYMALPLMTVVLVSFGGFAYVTRNIVLGVMNEDFVMAARAKGLPERKVIYGHVLRTASPPIVTMSALSIIGSLGGAIITETVFGWPGMGRVYWVAIQENETAVILGETFVTVFLFVATIALLNFIYGLLDPRVKVGQG